MSESGYLLDNSVAAAGGRLDALSQLFDPSTFRHIEELGITHGWRCWEVGAGGVSVVRWMADRVGHEGYVLATDIDVSWAEAARRPRVSVFRHDVARDPSPVEQHPSLVAPNASAAPDPSPEALFDLVHARLVLVHVPDRDHALRTMAAALRPGGWLLIEDADPALQPLSCLEARTPAEELANRLRSGFRELMAGRGVDLAYGRKLPRLLREAGLMQVRADAYFPVALPACASLEVATIQVIREQLVNSDIASAEEVDQHLENVRAGRLDLAQPPMISVWGRRQ